MDNMNSKQSAPVARATALPRAAGPAPFNPVNFFYDCDVASSILYIRKKEIVFSQGHPADSVFYIQKGMVKLTSVSERGKEAAITLLGPGELLGEECIAGKQPVRVTTAVAFSECTLLRVDRWVVEDAVRRKTPFLEFFMSSILARNIRLQETLADQLCLTSEKRLARVLLLLAGFNKTDDPEPVLPKIGQETLAEMVGTTRSRVNFYMNRFRERGFIEYDRELRIRKSLQSVLMED